MKTVKLIAAVLVALVMLAAPAFARGAREGDFLSGFEQALIERGFTEEEAAEVLEAARSLDWSSGRDADPRQVADVVAEIREALGIGPSSQAELAQVLAHSAVRLRAEGCTEEEVQQVMLQATVALRAQVSAWTDGGSQEQLGDLLRTRLSDATAEMTRTRETTRAAGDLESVSGTPATGSPAQDGAGPGSGTAPGAGTGTGTGSQGGNR